MAGARGAASGFQPANVPGGGPAGVGDPYLKLVASGIGGPGGKLVGIAPDQWFGDYIAAGITAIEMDVINLGSTDVNLRLYFSGVGGSGSSATGITLASGSGWTHVSFSTLPSAIAPAPAVQAADVLSNVSELRLFHSAAASFPGPNIAAQIGIDNVTAVPEPGTWATPRPRPGSGRCGRVTAPAANCLTRPGHLGRDRTGAHPPTGG